MACGVQLLLYVALILSRQLFDTCTTNIFCFSDCIERALKNATLMSQKCDESHRYCVEAKYNGILLPRCCLSNVYTSGAAVQVLDSFERFRLSTGLRVQHLHRSSRLTFAQQAQNSLSLNLCAVPGAKHDYSR